MNMLINILNLIIRSKIKYKKINLIIFLYLSFNFTLTNAQIYDEIKVIGNERLSVETIVMFSGLNIKSEISENDLNISIKNLYKTNFFKNIKIISKDKTLEIYIDENPIIQKIKINGVKNKSILNKFSEVTKKSEKYPFLKNQIIDQNNLLLNIARASGFILQKLIQGN